MAKSSRLSKMAANRLAVTATVTSSAAVHGGEVADTLHALLFPEGPQRSELTHKFLRALGGALDRAALEVQEADLEHAAELLDDEEPRLRRDGAHAQLATVMLEHRRLLDSLYGEKLSGFYGLAAALPVQSAALMQRARAVVKQLRTQGISAQPLRPGLAVKATDLISELEHGTAALEAALSDVKREEREGQLTQQRKTAATTTWQNTYQGVTYAFYGLYLLAGRPDLAERIEPTIRRRSGIPDANDAGNAPDDTNSQGDDTNNAPDDTNNAPATPKPA